MVVTRSSWYKAPWELSMHSGKIVNMLPASTETLTLARFFSTRLKPCKSIIVELIPSHNSVGQVSQDFFHLVMKFLFIQDQNLHKSEIGTRYTSTVKVTAVSKKEKEKKEEKTCSAWSAVFCITIGKLLMQPTEGWGETRSHDGLVAWLGINTA